MAFPSYWNEIHLKWQAIPEETDVLITHMPPQRILDDSVRIGGLGSPKLGNRIMQIEPKLHIFDHVHANRGMIKLGKTVLINGSQCFGSEATGAVEYLL